MAETKENTPKVREVEVTLAKDCVHGGESKKQGDRIKVTEAQRKVMQSHGLVAGGNE